MTGVLALLLMVGAIVAGVIGGMMLTQATLGVGVICGGCLMGIVARLLQADAQHRQLLKSTKT